jgi:hypothetical protein
MSPTGTQDQYAGKVDLSMPGDWTIQVRAKTPAGDVIQQELSVTVQEK